jgi:hypothetical protein
VAAVFHHASAPTETEIRTVVDGLRGADLGTFTVIESRARLLPQEAWSAVLEKFETRRRSRRGVDDDRRMLCYLLDVAIKERRRLAVEAQLQARVAVADDPAQLGLVERVKREDPDRYIRAMRGRPGFELEAYLAQYVDDAVERARLREVAA